MKNKPDYTRIAQNLYGTPQPEPKKATFVFDFKVPGLNGSDGLIRQHYHASKKLKKKIEAVVSRQKAEVFSGKVSITYTRYSVTQPDIDNLCASFKYIGDALVRQGVIKDDKPSIITEFIPKYGKAKNNDHQRAVVQIREVVSSTHSTNSNRL